MFEYPHDPGMFAELEVISSGFCTTRTPTFKFIITYLEPNDRTFEARGRGGIRKRMFINVYMKSGTVFLLFCLCGAYPPPSSGSTFSTSFVAVVVIIVNSGYTDRISMNGRKRRDSTPSKRLSRERQQHLPK